MESEVQIHRLRAFCELSFDSACPSPHQTKREVPSTASAAQMRGSIRAGPARGASYLERLQPLQERSVH